MKDYRRYSFWLETCGDDLTPRPPLDGDVAVDVAILGAGFTGLWTAYELLKRDPSLSVAIVEREIAGFGASGRNGGWCFSGFPVSPQTLTERYGRDAARQVSLEMYRSVDEVGRVTRDEGIDCHYEKGGALQVARADYDLPKLQTMYDEFRAIGLEDHYRLLDARESRERIEVVNAVGGFHNREGAAVQPARLARGLARAVERLGGTIYEQTTVTRFTGNPQPSLVTSRGTVRAATVVLAGEAYLSALPGLDRAIIPMTSHIVLTEPLPAGIWDRIRWRDRDVLGGWGVTGAYIQRTADGRIALGPYRGTYPYRSRVTDELDRDEAIFAHARRSAVEWFPELRGVRFTHAWGGVFGIPRDRMPRMTYDPRAGIAAAYGYTGDGVATANLSGRVLADLITDTDSPLQSLPMTRPNPSRWEPEPLRWMGVTFVRKDRQRVLRKIEREGRHPQKPALSQRLYDY
jgi:glycine/D-amino acid oxidase-like deaminating enzyme